MTVGVPGWLAGFPSTWKLLPAKAAFQERREPNRPADVHLTPSQAHGVLPQAEYVARTGNAVVQNIQGQDSMRHVDPDDFIIHLRSFQGGIERSTYEGKVSAAYTVLEPTGIVVADYFRWLLKSDGYIQELRTTTNQLRDGQSIKFRDFAKISLPVPPLDEQRAIADYLDRETARIDTLIEEQQRLIEMLRERRAAVVDAALAPSSSWTQTTLRHMLSAVDQGVSPQAEAGLADEEGAWGVLKTGCANYGTFRQEEHKRLPTDFTIDPTIAVGVGDVIVSRASGSPDLVGSAAIVERLDYQLILSDKLFRLRPRASVDPRFLVWSLNSGRYRVQVRRSISGAEGLANNLPLSKLRAFEMHYPKLDEQRKITAYLDDQTAKSDTLIAETEMFVELSRERRAALITAAVTGQIDVGEMV